MIRERELTRSARLVFITATPDVSSLTLASLRYTELADCGVPEDKMSLLVNRYQRRALPTREIERIVGHPVFMTLPDGSRDVQNAIVESRLVSSHIGFARACTTLAGRICGAPKVEHGFSRFALLQKISLLAR